MTNEEYKLTDEEWREFQSIPEQWFSHRAWVDARIAERVVDERAKTQEMKDYGDRAVHKLNQARFDLRDERAKRPDREQIARIQFEIDNVHQIHGETCLCGFKSSRSRSRTEHLTALFADAVLALEPEAREDAGPALRIDDDGAHIYWSDPVEGCWVAFRRVDCVGEEELPERRLPAPEAREITDAEVAVAYSAFVQASFGFPGAPAMRAALEAAREVSRGDAQG